MSGNLEVDCLQCGAQNVFSQPYAYHAGFGDTVFLYNEAGNCTLAWGTYDPEYIRLIGDADAWQPTPAVQAELEARLPPSPHGDRWGFAHPARCLTCRAAIRDPMIKGERYYLEYSASVIVGRAGLASNLASLLDSRPSA
jgi:hypothetical protein